MYLFILTSFYYENNEMQFDEYELPYDKSEVHDFLQETISSQLFAANSQQFAAKYTYTIMDKVKNEIYKQVVLDIKK